MQLKPQRQLLNSTSKRVLRQLEENESLRIELFRLRSDMRDQHHHFLNSTLNHEMLLEKIITELSLACRRASQLRNRPENNTVLYSAIEHSVCDLQGILESHGRLRGEWSKSKPDASELYYQKLLKECSERIDSAQISMQQLKNERECLLEEGRLKMTQVQFLQGELGKLKQRYDFSVQQSNSLRAENSKLSQTIADCQLKLGSCGGQVAKLKSSNDALSDSLKQSRQVANRHTEYLNSKCEGIQRENKRLIDMLKENQLKEQQMAAKAAASQQQIEQLKEETQRLKAQVQTFQIKFREIIDKQNRIRQLQTIKQKKAESREPLSQIKCQSSSDQSQGRPWRKEAGKVINKKFNLQSFQEKLSTGHSTISLHDPSLPV